MSDCRKAIKRDGARPPYLKSLGRVYLRLGNHAEVIKVYQQALAQSSKLAWSHYWLGLAELHSGQTEAGRAELAVARTINKEIDTRAAKYGLAPSGAAPASGVADFPSSK